MVHQGEVGTEGTTEQVRIKKGTSDSTIAELSRVPRADTGQLEQAITQTEKLADCLQSHKEAHLSAIASTQLFLWKASSSAVEASERNCRTQTCCLNPVQMPIASGRVRSHVQLGSGETNLSLHQG